jgi:PAS domain-containing protein
MVQDITGYDEEFTSGKVRWEQIIHPDDMGWLMTTRRKNFKQCGFSSDKEYRIIRKDGVVRRVHQAAKPGGRGRKVVLQGRMI